MSGLARERCITCSDGAVEAEVVAVDGDTAVVSVVGERGFVTELVAVDLVPDAAPGDVLLCHAGIALERVERRHEPPQVTESHDVVAHVARSNRVCNPAECGGTAAR